MEAILTDKIGVYSTLMSYYATYPEWKSLYLKSNRSSSNFWSKNQSKFECMNDLFKFNFKAVNNLGVVNKVLEPAYKDDLARNRNN